jgi:putative ABC transport system permease protein
MKLGSTMRIGLDALRTHRLRTLLSTLGVVIGVGALVSVLALGDGVEAFSRSQIAETTDLHAISLRASTTRDVDGVRVPREEVVRFVGEDAQAAAVMLGPRVDLDVVATSASPVTTAGSVRAAAVFGVAGYGAQALTLRSGRFFEVGEAASGGRAAVVSAPLAAEPWSNRRRAHRRSTCTCRWTSSTVPFRPPRAPCDEPCACAWQRSKRCRRRRSTSSHGRATGGDGTP